MELFENLSTELCKNAIISCFPQLTVTTIQRNNEGWDNCVFLINNEFIFRFPRYPEAARRLDLERRLLPELQKVINTPIPQFEFVSTDCPEFKRLFVGYRMIKGVPLTPTLLRQHHSEALTQKLATQIAKFLSSLHSYPVEKALELGVSSNQKKERIFTLYNEIQRKVFPILKRLEQEWTQNIFESFLNNEQFFQYTSVLVHGDFSLDNILFDKEQEKIGIIDFGDVSIGDPAYDFPCLADYGATFDQWVLAHYQGNLDPTFLQRRNFYRDCICFWEILGGIDLNNPKYLEIGLTRLRKTIQTKKSRSQNGLL